MRFLGIDFGWTSQPSGVAALDWDGRSLQLAAFARPPQPEDVLSWVDTETANGAAAMIAIDAPTIIVNPTGMREVDKETHRRFGKYHAGCYPANLSRPFARRTTALSNDLLRRGFLHAPSIEPRRDGRFQIEVHPHAACVRLFRLERILKYKRGSVAERRERLREYRGLLIRHLSRLQPRVAGLKRLPEIEETVSGSELKAVEDQLDAVLCAYIGAHWWAWGGERNEVLGSGEGGFIIVPSPR